MLFSYVIYQQITALFVVVLPVFIPFNSFPSSVILRSRCLIVERNEAFRAHS